MVGNLGDHKLGLSNEVWEELAQSVDVVIHNGALVHWVYARRFRRHSLADAYQIPVLDTQSAKCPRYD